MTHILELFDPSEYIAAFELKGRDVTATISRVVGGEVQGEDGKKAKKPIVYFSDWPKPLVLGKKMAKQLIKMYGTDPKAYVGKQLTMYPTEEKCFGEMMEVVRLRPRVMRTQQPPPPPTEPKPIAERVEMAIKAINEKNTIAGVENVYINKCTQLITELEKAEDSASIDRITSARDERLRALQEAT